ncbi:MAG TPA: enoyl-CoA hydratase-related protein [Euzebyales bacterium]|nr:enoyl-CoA hydratase-related protein [Euzebyales bacterium]
MSDSEHEDLYVGSEGPIAWLVLNRPAKRNAVTFAMWQRLPELLTAFEQNPEQKVLVVRGAGNRAFSAGADISEFETYRATSEDTQGYNAAAEKAQDLLAAVSKPTIAMVQGACVGGGCGLAMSCDVRFSDRSARFAITPARLGLVYPVNVTKRLVDLVGPAQAKAMLYTGMTLGAERAAALGLVNDLFAEATIEADTTAFAETIASRAQYSVRSTKRIVDLIASGLSEENEETLSLRAGAFDTADYREGVRAFLEKRPAVFRD